jgi:hypothetical protein
VTDDNTQAILAAIDRLGVGQDALRRELAQIRGDLAETRGELA